MEGNPIQFEDLINFKGGFDDIRKMISLLEIMINQGIDLGKSYETAGKKISESLDQVKESAKEVQKQLASEKDESKIVPFIETNINQNNTLIHNNTLTPIIEENLEINDEVSQQKINNDCKKEEQKKKRGRKKKTN